MWKGMVPAGLLLDSSRYLWETGQRQRTMAIGGESSDMTVGFTDPPSLIPGYKESSLFHHVLLPLPPGTSTWPLPVDQGPINQGLKPPTWWAHKSLFHYKLITWGNHYSDGKVTSTWKEPGRTSCPVLRFITMKENCDIRRRFDSSRQSALSWISWVQEVYRL